MGEFFTFMLWLCIVFILNYIWRCGGEWILIFLTHGDSECHHHQALLPCALLAFAIPHSPVTLPLKDDVTQRGQSFWNLGHLEPQFALI